MPPPKSHMKNQTPEQIYLPPPFHTVPVLTDWDGVMPPTENPLVLLRWVQERSGESFEEICRDSPTDNRPHEKTLGAWLRGSKGVDWDKRGMWLLETARRALTRFAEERLAQQLLDDLVANLLSDLSENPNRINGPQFEVLRSPLGRRARMYRLLDKRSESAATWDALCAAAEGWTPAQVMPEQFIIHNA